MVTAIVLLTAEKDKVHSIAETLADMKEITEVYSIAGRYDLGVIVRGKDNGIFLSSGSLGCPVRLRSGLKAKSG